MDTQRALVGENRKNNNFLNQNSYWTEVSWYLSCAKCSRAVCTSLHSVLTALVRTQAAWRTETVLMFVRLLLRAKNQANLTCDYKPVHCYRCKGIHGYTPKRSVPRLFHLHSVLSQGLQDFMSLRLTVYRASSCFSRSVKHRTADSKVSQTTTKKINTLFTSYSLPVSPGKPSKPVKLEF